MTPPPIRYPLPTLILIVALGLIVWLAEVASRPLRSALAERWQRTVEGPPIPASTTPKVVAGPIVRRALLLHDDVATSAVPEGREGERIGVRMFVDIYDVWPLEGEPTHFRVGNRRPIGWARTVDLLPWNTRLVLQPSGEPLSIGETPNGPFTPQEVGKASLPVIAWNDRAIEVVVWDRDRPWQAIERRGWVPIDRATRALAGVWMSHEELLDLLRRSLGSSTEKPQILRLRAVLGRLADDRPITSHALDEARAALPLPVFENEATSDQASERLARVNEAWKPEASWGGLSFAAVPLADLP
jgi:hypothetical protein